MWQVNERPSLRFVQDVVRMTRVSDVTLELTRDAILQSASISEDPKATLLDSMEGRPVRKWHLCLDTQREMMVSCFEKWHSKGHTTQKCCFTTQFKMSVCFCNFVSAHKPPLQTNLLTARLHPSTCARSLEFIAQEKQHLSCYPAIACSVYTFGTESLQNEERSTVADKLAQAYKEDEESAYRQADVYPLLA